MINSWQKRRDLNLFPVSPGIVFFTLKQKKKNKGQITERGRKGGGRKKEKKNGKYNLYFCLQRAKKGTSYSSA